MQLPHYLRGNLILEQKDKCISVGLFQWKQQTTTTNKEDNWIYYLHLSTSGPLGNIRKVSLRTALRSVDSPREIWLSGILFFPNKRITSSLVCLKIVSFSANWYSIAVKREAVVSLAILDGKLVGKLHTYSKRKYHIKAYLRKGYLIPCHADHHDLLCD